MSRLEVALAREADTNPGVARILAAQMLGMALREVTAVRNTTAGVVIATFDGAEYIVVPDDKPDGDQKVGLMFHREPVAGYSRSHGEYVGVPASGGQFGTDNFPVYTPPGR
jgi:hypothetical protein